MTAAVCFSAEVLTLDHHGIQRRENLVRLLPMDGATVGYPITLTGLSSEQLTQLGAAFGRRVRLTIDLLED